MSKKFLFVAMSAVLAMSFFASAAMASHDHPIGGSPVRVPLVPAFKACASANSQHGLPLNFPSCNPPVPGSTVSQMGPQSIGSAWLIVCNVGSAVGVCNETGPGFTTSMQPDVRIFGSIRDVRCRTAGSPPPCVAAGDDFNPNGAAGPYTTTCTTAASCGNDGRPEPLCKTPGTCTAGVDMLLVANLAQPGGTVDPSTQCGTNTTCLAFAGKFVGHSIRVTDHYNCDTDPSLPPTDANACPADATTSNRAATMVDVLYPIPADCLPQPGAIGSTCGVNTTANSILPGAVISGKQAVVEIGEIQAFDGGIDGNVGTGANNQLLATMGLYLP